MGRVKKTRKGLEEERYEKDAKTTNAKTYSSSEESENDCIQPVSQKSFAALKLDESLSEPDLVEETDEVPKQLEKSNKKHCGGTKNTHDKNKGNAKKSKKSRRKHDSDDEEIEKVLAELELEYAGVNIPQENKTVSNKDQNSGASIEKESNLSQQEQEFVEKDHQKKKGKKDKQKSGLGKSATTDSHNSNCKNTVFTENNSANIYDKTNSKIISPTEEKQNKKEKFAKETPELQDAPSAKGKASNETVEGQTDAQTEEKEDKKKKKKSSKDKQDKESKETKKGPGKKTIAAMQEALKKMREQEEKARKEEEEKLRREEELEKARLEALRLEQERKEKKKQKEKERKERLKAEGKLLTAKQKADRARAQNLIESLKAQGIEFPEIGVKKPRPGTRVKQSKPQKEHTKSPEENVSENREQYVIENPSVDVSIVEEKCIEEAASDDDVKDAWDVSSDDELAESTVSSDVKVIHGPEETRLVEDESESSSENHKSSSEDESLSEDDKSTEKMKATILERILARRDTAEKKKDPNNLRAAVVCVLGHVDTGKTKILDKLRRTNVQDCEAGGITQQIGATNVPIEAIREQIKIVRGASEMDLKVPGLLIIDTPGHESFTNLRNRGSSLCDIAILVVDIMHGLEPQTIESINILKSKKTPFIVALNKIDRLYNWQTMNRKDVRDIIKAQAPNTILEFERRTKEVIVQFAEQGLNAALFFENPDPRSYVSLVPTSAITGEGMGNLLALIMEFCQLKLQKRLMYSEELQATVLEVKAIPGLGTTIDVILVNGHLREGDTMICAGTDGPIVTQIRSLLMPQPLKELRVKSAYIEHKEVKAAQGVKIAAKDLEKAIAGLNLYVAQKLDEIEILKDEITKELKSALSGIKLQERGVYVQASTLGSLEALLEFLRSSKIPFSGIRIGPVAKRDVMKASVMLEHDSQYATILAFDVKVERDAQELADNLGVKIFQADIIYHLFDKFMAYREELKQQKREEFKNIAVFPCKLRVLPQFVFNSRDPIVCGVMVEAGVVKEGTPICVPSKDFLDLGHITSVEVNHKPVDSARKGMEVCIKIEPVPGESPKMFGRHFDETDMLVSKISRQSIDACKEYFRDDLLKTDWQLMVELKKMFQIL